MLQIAFIRESRESVIQVKKRNMDAKSIVEDVIKLDTERRAASRVRRYFS
jgi:seryl-tRNA synthetase